MKTKEFFNEYIKVFLSQNEKLNLVSKNDEKYLWEKHIYDSLSIEKFFERYIDSLKDKKLLDIGTGGGFPSVPTAMCYPELQVYALDSIRKKIGAIESIKSDLKIENLHTICDRVENISQKFDIITSRAVASLKILVEYAIPLLKNDGYFVAYKSLKVDEEIKDAKNILNKYNAEIIDTINYDLPLIENFTRKLVIIKSKVK